MKVFLAYRCCSTLVSKPCVPTNVGVGSISAPSVGDAVVLGCGSRTSPWSMHKKEEGGGLIEVGLSILPPATSVAAKAPDDVMSTGQSTASRGGS